MGKVTLVSVTIGMGDFIHNSNACARFVSCGLISCFIVGMPFCPYQFGRKIRVLSVPKRKPNVDNYMDII